MSNTIVGKPTVFNPNSEVVLKFAEAFTRMPEVKGVEVDDSTINVWVRVPVDHITITVVSEKRPSHRAAAKWWADQLRNGTTMLTGSKEHDSLLQMKHSMIPKLDEDIIQKFEECLKIEINEQRQFSDKSEFSLWTDYGASTYLRTAAEKSGFDPAGRFPVKTTMFITNSYVEVSRGYGQPFELIYGKKE